MITAHIPLIGKLYCAALLMLLGTGASAGEEDEIVTGCHFANAEWGVEMVERCVRDNQQIRNIVLQYSEMHKPIVNRCRRGNDNGWAWVKTCVDNDIEAQSALAQYPKEIAGLIDLCDAEFGLRGAALVKKCVDRALAGPDPKNNN